MLTYKKGQSYCDFLGGDLGKKRLQINTHSVATVPSCFSPTDKIGNIVGSESQFPPRARGGGAFVPRPSRGDIKFMKGRRGDKLEFGKTQIGYRRRKILSTFMDGKAGRFKADGCLSRCTAVQMYLKSH